MSTNGQSRSISTSTNGTSTSTNVPSTSTNGPSRSMSTSINALSTSTLMFLVRVQVLMVRIQVQVVHRQTGVRCLPVLVLKMCTQILLQYEYKYRVLQHRQQNTNLSRLSISSLVRCTMPGSTLMSSSS